MLKKAPLLFVPIAALLLLLYACSPVFTRSLNVPRITPQELNARIESGTVTVIDVRQERDWERTPYKITGALRELPSDIESWAGKYPKDAPLVLYCA